MNNSLNRLIDGIVIALEREIIPRVDDAYARGQAFAVMDLLRNMRPRLEWSREVTLAQVGLQEAALKRVDDLCRGQVERPPAYAPPSAASITLDTKQLEARRDRLEAEVCGVLKWLTEHRSGARRRGREIGRGDTDELHARGGQARTGADRESALRGNLARSERVRIRQKGR